MTTFLQMFDNKIKGAITGFDRLVFKGMIRPLMYAAGAQSFLGSHGILNKDYKEWMLAQTTELVQSVDGFAKTTCGQGIIPIASCHTRKETLAHAHQKDTGITSGLIGVWSCVESATSYRATFDPKAGYPQLRVDNTRCRHLYFYYDHPVYGFMSVRLQTWFPYEIQVAINGREWLRRSLDAAQCPYVNQGNKFLHIADYSLAQQLLDKQMDTRWNELLTSFLPEVFPTMRLTLGENLDYYWTAWQSEWATDYVFDNTSTVALLMDGLLRHALMTGTSERLLRYFGRPVRPDGQPHPLADPEIITRIQKWYDGVRIRHWVDHNSVKLYNEHNVLRVEMTMNEPARFKVFRHKEGQQDTPKQRLPLRKGVADLPLRAQVAADVNNRFIAQMATMKDATPVRQVLSEVQSFTKNGKRVRALDPLGKDQAFLEAISDPAFTVSGITNKALQKVLGGTSWANGKTDKALSARISRHLRLLRDHGLISKLPKQRKYQLTEKGRRLTMLVNVLSAASTDQLLAKAA